MPTFDTSTYVLPVPTFTYGVELGIEATGLLYEDHTEQRFLTSSGEGLTLFYDYALVDSATMCVVRSVFLDAQGPATIFTATDYRTQSAVKVRFAEQDLSITIQPGNSFRIGPIPLRVVG